MCKGPETGSRECSSFCSSGNCIEWQEGVVEEEVRGQIFQSLVQGFGLKYGHKKKKGV